MKEGRLQVGGLSLAPRLAVLVLLLAVLRRRVHLSSGPVQLILLPDCDLLQLSMQREARRAYGGPAGGAIVVKAWPCGSIQLLLAHDVHLFVLDHDPHTLAPIPLGEQRLLGVHDVDYRLGFLDGLILPVNRDLVAVGDLLPRIRAAGAKTAENDMPVVDLQLSGG